MLCRPAARALVCVYVAIVCGIGTSTESSQLDRYRRAMPPTLEESRELSYDLQEQLHAGNLVAVNRLLDTASLVERVVDGIDVRGPSFESFLERLIMGLQESAWFGEEVVETLEAGGDYRFLDIVDRDGARVAIFRLLTFDGGLNYHEMTLERRGLAGPVKVVDVYVYMTGERLSDSYRRSFSESGVRAAELARLNELMETRQWEAAHRHYGSLPSAVQAERAMLTKKLMITQNLGDELYLETIEDIRKHFPDDPALDLISLDAYVLSGDYERAMAVLDRLDRRVCGDPYLNVQRAGIHLLERRYERATELARRAVSSDPHLEPGYWTLATIALDTKNWSLLVEALDGLEDNLAVELDDLAAMPEYREFVDSEEYEVWEKRGQVH